MNNNVEFGLDTFGDVTVDGDGNPPVAGAGDSQRDRGGRARRSAGHRQLRRRRASPRRLRHLGARGRARRDRQPHRAHPPRHRRDRAELGRSGAGVRTLRHARLRSPAGGPRSRSGAARSPSRSRCSGTTWPTTSGCSRKSSTCSRTCSRKTPSRGRAASARRCRTSTCIPRPKAGASAPGSASAAARSRWCAPRSTGSRSCWPSSAAARPGSRPYVDLYHRALREFGHEPQPVAVHSPGFIAATDAGGGRRPVAARAGAVDAHRSRARLAADHARTVRVGRRATARGTSARPRPSPGRSRAPCKR